MFIIVPLEYLMYNFTEEIYEEILLRTYIFLVSCLSSVCTPSVSFFNHIL